jgi:hypothetical protein
MMAAAPEEIGALLGTIFVGSSLLVLVRAWARKIENQRFLTKLLSERGERPAGALPRPGSSRENSP